MKLKNLVGDRFKERPSDCVIDSHAFSVRGGYIKYVANGIFSLYPSMKRITKKIENIIREEMDGIDAVSQAGGLGIAGENMHGHIGIDSAHLLEDRFQNGLVTGVSAAIDRKSVV